MPSILLFLALLLPGLALAQAPSRKKVPAGSQSSAAATFDPAVYFSAVQINQMYGEGNFHAPDGWRMSLVDTIWANERAIGFSIRMEPGSSPGWQLWLDFDADVYYRPRLVRILAQRPIAKDKTDSFASYRDWVATVQQKNIGAAMMKKAGQISWPWLTRTSYFLTLKQESVDGIPWLLLVLQREEM